MKRLTRLFAQSMAISVAVYATTASGTTYTFEVLDLQVGSGTFSFSLNPSANYPENTVFPLSVNGVTPDSVGANPWDPTTSTLSIFSGPPPWFQVYVLDSASIGAGVSNYLPDHAGPWTGLEIVEAVAAAPQVALRNTVPDGSPGLLGVAGLVGLMLLPRRVVARLRPA